MSTILNIKGIRKWRVTHDELNWVVQKHKPKNKPPNDWTNEYYCSTLESLIDTLVDLNIDPSKINDLKALSAHTSKLKRALRGLIQKLFEETGGKLPNQKRKTEEKKKRKTKKKTKKK